MDHANQFSLLRTILKALGLSAEAIDDIVERIDDWLSDKPAAQLEFPYRVRDDFLSLAEQSFYMVLKAAVADWAIVCPKVALGDLFFAKSGDASKYRTYTNKIDRKHIDFLLCDPKTVRPLLGIELDDKSHNRADRKERDEFVGQVFAAAQLRLVHIPVRQSYSVAELNALLRATTVSKSAAAPVPPPAPISQPAPAPQLAAPISQVPAPISSPTSPPCPKCGSAMILRTAKRGDNQGNQFWGCSNYPRCHGVVKYEPAATQP
ncbi:MAG: DUF2726 domain-containing protein [Anaerolineae bacterium]